MHDYYCRRNARLEKSLKFLKKEGVAFGHNEGIIFHKNKEVIHSEKRITLQEFEQNRFFVVSEVVNTIPVFSKSRKTKNYKQEIKDKTYPKKDFYLVMSFSHKTIISDDDWELLFNFLNLIGCKSNDFIIDNNVLKTKNSEDVNKTILNRMNNMVEFDVDEDNGYYSISCFYGYLLELPYFRKIDRFKKIKLSKIMDATLELRSEKTAVTEADQSNYESYENVTYTEGSSKITFHYGDPDYGTWDFLGVWRTPS